MKKLFAKAWIALATKNWIDARFYIARLYDLVDCDGADAAQLIRLDLAYGETFGI